MARSSLLKKTARTSKTPCAILNVRYPVAIDSKPVRFKVTLDGKAPADNCVSDSAPDGTGQVQQPRLYQLIRQKGQIQDRSFEIEFLDPGVQAFVFTFG